ncbi:hypothetical protein AAMO2058_001074700 [Amorphochlora amoebiformis]
MAGINPQMHIRPAMLLLLAALVDYALADSKYRIGFGNDCSETLETFWVNPQDGREMLVSNIEPRGQSWIDTFRGHRFVFRKPDGTKVSETVAEVESKFHAIQCEHPCHVDYGGAECIQSLEGVRLKSTLQGAWDDMNHERILVNEAQPSALINFTETGFEKMPIPENVWSILNKYYQDNKNSIVLEKWPSTNPYINHWEGHPMMIWLPELHTGNPIKQQIFDGLRPVLEKWSGKKLEQTDMYGMRVYKKNLYLENHVDRLSTHVVSCIMHIDDSGDHEWPLNILSHDGKEHNVTIKPGEMVLYESATCPHGRPSKFQGDYYVNAFAHFRPTDWIDTLKRLNKEGKITKWSKGPGEIDQLWQKGVHDEL